VANRSGRAGGGARPRTRAESVVVPFSRSGTGDRLDLGRLVPSGRSLALAFALLAGAVGAYVVARETALFGVHQIAVEGAPPGVARQVERALGETRGTSLLAVDVAAARTAVQALPWVADVSFDRAYPHTLRVTVTPERPVAVARQGPSSFLVSASGRVVARVDKGVRPELARIWVRSDVKLEPGLPVAGDSLAAVEAVSPLAGSGFPERVTSVTVGEEAITLRLRSGLELRLGEPVDLDLKLAVAAAALPKLQPGATYLDVSVPERPVAGAESSTSYGP
jgi:cell division protein FtsQ